MRLTVAVPSGVAEQAGQAADEAQPNVECALRRYVARYAYGIATDADAVAAFSTEFPDARAVFARAGVR